MLSITLLTIVFFIISVQAEEIEEYWEEHGENDELAFILEYGTACWDWLKPEIIGYRLYLSPMDSSSLEAVIPNRQKMFKPREGIGFSFTLRNSGDVLDRRMVRSELSYSDAVSIGYITESDPGEDWGDFHAYYLTYRSDSWRAVLGNYSAGFGQGLALWRGFNWGVYPENPVSPFKSDFLRGYSSTGENGALFGGGIQRKGKVISLIAFYSDSKWDASAGEDGVITLQTSGEHTTSSQLENKDKLRERIYGSRLNIHIASLLSLGLSLTSADYSPPFAPVDSVKGAFDFIGNRNMVWGADGVYERDIFTAAGEFARTSSGGTAGLARFQLKFDKVTCQLSMRDFSPDYKNLRSIEPDGNERGFTLAFSLKPWQGGLVNAYIDSWRRPWRTYSYEMPPAGYQTALFIKQKISDYELSFRLRKTYNDRGSDELIRNQFRLNVERDLGRITVRLRFEKMAASSSESDEVGCLISGGLKGGLFTGRGELSVSRFEIPDYDCRIYQYQANVPGMFGVPFYFGNGFNVNVVYKLNLFRDLTLAAEASITQYSWKPNMPGGEIDRTFSLYLSYRRSP